MIQAHALQKWFGQKPAVEDVSLGVNAGEVYGLVGSDGAGKTTTLRLLCGALRPDGGEITIGGVDMVRQTELARAQIGYLPQRFSLYEEMTVVENLRFFAEVRGLEDADWKPRCLEILAFVGLGDFTGRRAGQLSGGMKQKLGLAAALVHRPRILLLDEPTTGVDPVTRQDFWQLIIHLIAEEGVAVLVSTPYMDEAARCGRVGFMRQGKILIEGTPNELCQNLEGVILELRGQPLPLLRQIASRDEDVEDAQMFGDRLHLRIPRNRVQGVLLRLRKAIPSQQGRIDRLREIQPQLEDVFIAMLEHKS